MTRVGSDALHAAPSSKGRITWGLREWGELIASTVTGETRFVFYSCKEISLGAMGLAGWEDADEIQRLSQQREHES